MRRAVPLAIVLLCGLAPWARAEGGAPARRDTTKIVLPPPAPGVTVLCGGIDGTQVEGGTVVYTILLRNDGPADQADVAFRNVLPVGVTLDYALADSGMFTYGAAPLVLWDGPIPAGGTATIQIAGLIDPGTKGMTFCDTPLVFFDSNGNPASAVVVPCCFTIPATVPTLSGPMLAVLALLLALLAFRRLRRRAL